MSFDAAAAFDKSKMNLKPKCFYLMNVVKHEFPKLWEQFQPEFSQLTPEHSWDFYHKLLQAYQEAKQPKPKKDRPHLKAVVAKAEKKAAVKKAPAKKKAPVKKKAAVKKKAPAKKSEAKKKAAPKKKAAAKKK